MAFSALLSLYFAKINSSPRGLEVARHARLRSLAGLRDEIVV
jgi:hypothetical protein